MGDVSNARTVDGAGVRESRTAVRNAAGVQSAAEMERSGAPGWREGPATTKRRSTAAHFRSSGPGWKGRACRRPSGHAAQGV